MVGAIQLVIDGGDAVSITWQVLPYVLLTFGEVLVSATGLEFAYSQAPPSMKGAIMSFWYLSVTIGNLWVLLANAGVQNSSVTNSALHRLGRNRIPNVLLRRFRLRRFPRLRPRSSHLSGRRPLPQACSLALRGSA